MKGSLHTDELMARCGVADHVRYSHRPPDQPLASSWMCWGYPEALIITDAAVNIAL